MLFVNTFLSHEAILKRTQKLSGFTFTLSHRVTSTSCQRRLIDKYSQGEKNQKKTQPQSALTTKDFAIIKKEKEVTGECFKSLLWCHGLPLMGVLCVTGIARL